MSMFCFQCQETAKGTGCTVSGVCGKKPDTANLQDVLMQVTKELAVYDQAAHTEVDGEMIMVNLFTTITNANFDNAAIVARIQLTYRRIVQLAEEAGRPTVAEQAAELAAYDEAAYLELAPNYSILAEKDEDIRSLKELITYGLKGLAAYIDHARKLGYRDAEVEQFISKTLAALLEQKSVEDLVALTLATGEAGVKGMALLDKANTESYGTPEATKVFIGVRNNPGILVSGHDLHDLKMLLDQTQGTGVDVYTHGEMLPANSYPELKKYDNLVGNYGGAWYKQTEEFGPFNGPILFTTNCITPPKAEYKDRVFTTGAAGFPGFPHIEEDEKGWKDFSSVIEMAKSCQSPVALEDGYINGGFAHGQVLALADKVVEAVKSGAIKQFYVMGGCDGRHKSREYYTEFAKALDPHTVILTSGCAKYRYNKLNLGEIGGIPRVLDAGQCNDSYSLAVIALKLKEAFGLEDINQLPIVFNIAWYEQKAVIVLLGLLSLGVKNIHLGPTMPGFLSPNVANVLVENFGIAGIGSVEEDIQKFAVA